MSLELTEGERYARMGQVEKTEWLVEGVRRKIAASGGPDHVRFAAVPMEVIARAPGEQNAEGPLKVWVKGTHDDTGLVEIVLKRIEDDGDPMDRVITAAEEVRQLRESIDARSELDRRLASVAQEFAKVLAAYVSGAAAT